MIDSFFGYRFEGMYDPTILTEPYARAAFVVLDRLQAHAPWIRKLYESFTLACDAANAGNPEYETAKEAFLAADPFDKVARDTFNIISDHHYYNVYYGPAVFASATFAASYDLIRWADLYIIRSRVGSQAFGALVGKDLACNIAGAPFGSVVTAMRHHSAHFEEWVDPTPREFRSAKPSWDTLRKLGYKIPLGNVSVVDDALGRIADNADQYIARLAGAVLDLARIAETKGATPIDQPDLYRRSQMGLSNE